MNIFEAMSMAKLYYSAMSGQVSVSKMEVEVACKALKEMAEQRQDWTREQKDFYELLVDFAKEQSRGQ